MRLFVSLSPLLLSLSATVAAADEVGKWYVNPLGGYLLTDNDRGIDDDVYYGLSTGRHISREWSAELNVVTGDYDFDPGVGEFDITAVAFDALRVFSRDSRFSPFISGGLGFIGDRRGSANRRNNNVLAELGAGVLIDLFESSGGGLVLHLRPEIKGRIDFFDRGPIDDFVDVSVGVGFSISFGESDRARSEPVPAAAPPPPPAPSPPPPPPEPVAAPAPPAPPPPPADSDGDGVLDTADQCADTPRGTAVDPVGCPRKGSITLQGVNFETNAATLTSDSRPVLEEVAADLKKYPRLKIEVQGHTDSVGADAYNLDLSQRRAAAVREYLVGQGVTAEQLSANGYGETQPIANNTTPAGRKENRRVVLAVVDNPGDVEVEQAR
jgi:OmpA-OmpF porin, OOP family